MEGNTKSSEPHYLNSAQLSKSAMSEQQILFLYLFNEMVLRIKNHKMWCD